MHAAVPFVKCQVYLADIYFSKSVKGKGNNTRALSFCSHLGNKSAFGPTFHSLSLAPVFLTTGSLARSIGFFFYICCQLCQGVFFFL